MPNHVRVDDCVVGEELFKARLRTISRRREHDVSLSIREWAGGVLSIGDET